MLHRWNSHWLGVSCLATLLAQCSEHDEPSRNSSADVNVDAASPELKACAAEDQWPPYDYLGPNGEVIGASVDALREILSRSGRTVRVAALPWKRCLHYVQQGEFQIALNASPNAERREHYFVSPALYRVQQTLYYLASAQYQFGGAPTLTRLTQSWSAAAPNQVRLCGLFGYNLSVFPIGRLPLDQSPKSASQAMAMLRHGRCSLVIGYREPWDAAARLGFLDITGVERSDIAEVPSLTYHFLSTRASQGAGELAQALAAGIAELQRDGSLNRIFEAHGVAAQGGPGP